MKSLKQVWAAAQRSSLLTEKARIRDNSYPGCENPLFLVELFLESLGIFLDIALHLIAEALAALVFAAGERIFELAQQILLLIAQVLRHLNVHREEQITLGRAAQLLNALRADAEGRALLRTRRNAVLHRALKRRDVDIAAQRRLRKADRHIAVQIVAVALEDLVRTHRADHIQVLSLMGYGEKVKKVQR